MNEHIVTRSLDCRLSHDLYMVLNMNYIINYYSNRHLEITADILFVIRNDVFR